MNDVKTTPDPFSYLNAVGETKVSPEVEKSRMVYCLGKPKFDAFTHLEVVKRNWV
jgi:hypothetical protein